MVINVKEYYFKNFEIFEDVECVRKVLSNYMIKMNLVYKLVQGYSCIVVFIFDDLQLMDFMDEDVGGGEEDVVGEDDVEGEEDEDVGEDDEEDEQDDEDDGNLRKIILK